MIHKIREKLKKGSALVFALIILAMLLAIAVAIANVSSRERRLAGINKASSQAFQVADSGAEIVLRKIDKAVMSGTTMKLSNIEGGGCAVIDGRAQVQNSVAGGTFAVTLLGQDNNELTTCDVLLSDVYGLKSVGRYAGTVRAIQTAVATSTCAAGATTEILTRSNDQAIDSTKFAVVENFVNGGGIIASFICRTAGNLWTFNNDTVFDYTSSPNIVYFYGPGSSPGKCTKGMACQDANLTNCTGGWKIIRFCD